MGNCSLAHAYLQIELEDESKPLTTINTHKGLFQYHRLPFGVSSSPAIIQRTLESLLADIPKVAIFLDDILVTRSNEAEHLLTLGKVEKLESAGFTLKQSKCKFGLRSVEYLGHIIDQDGLHPSPMKLLAIRKAPIPKNVTELKAFLGLLNYYQFIINFCLICLVFYFLSIGYYKTKEHTMELGK